MAKQIPNRWAGTQLPLFIQVNTQNRTDYIFLHEVICLKGAEKSTTFFVTDLLHHQPMRVVVDGHHLGHYDFLLGKGFARPNRSYSINLRFLSGIKERDEIVLRGYEADSPICLSRNKRDEFFELVNQYSQTGITNFLL